MPESKNFRSYRQKNPFNNPSDSRSIEHEKIDAPFFGNDNAIFNAKDLARKRASNHQEISQENELNFSFKEDSNIDDHTQNSNALLNNSFGDKNNLFKED